MTIRHCLVLLGLAAAALAPAWAQTEQAPKPQRLRVSSGVAEKNKTHDVQPKYPQEARDKGIEGDVILQATIDTRGHMANLRLAQGDPILGAAAIDAVKKWRYKPYILNGKPVEVETTVKIQFHLGRS
jgi:periplasmic protein TonB